MTWAARVRFGLALAVVPVFAAVLSAAVRGGIRRAAVVIGDDPTETRSLASLPIPARFVLVFTGIAVAALVGRAVQGRHPQRIGVGAIAAAARGDGPGPVFGATMARSAATFAASASLASIGREAAILEAGGTVGLHTGRLLRVDAADPSGDIRPGPATAAVAAAGIAAGFASTYHAPMAGLLYVEEHLGVRRRPLAACAAAIGAAVGHIVSLRFLDSRALFAAVAPERRPAVVTLGLIVLVPTLVAGRLFRTLRRRITTASVTKQWHWLGVAAFGATLLALAPEAAGNGMSAIRSTGVTGNARVGVGLLVTLAVVKLVATCATLGSGAPGGVFSPAMAVSVGWALLVLDVARRLGASVPNDLWPAVLAAMAIGIAIGFQAPLVATFAVAEMTGDLRLVPFTAVIVGAAWLLNRGLDLALGAARSRRGPTHGSGPGSTSRTTTDRAEG